MVAVVKLHPVSSADGAAAPHPLVPFNLPTQ